MLRRNFMTGLVAGSVAQFTLKPLAAQSQRSNSPVFLERPATGQPHKGKVLLALQAHSDDIPLMAAGTVAKLIEEGYTGYLVRATNDGKPADQPCVWRHRRDRWRVRRASAMAD